MFTVYSNIPLEEMPTENWKIEKRISAKNWKIVFKVHDMPLPIWILEIFKLGETNLKNCLPTTRFTSPLNVGNFLIFWSWKLRYFSSLFWYSWFYVWFIAFERTLILIFNAVYNTGVDIRSNTIFCFIYSATRYYSLQD